MIWTKSEYSDNVVKDENGEYLAGISKEYRSREDVQKALNLIVAAPELLSALEHCIAYFESQRPMGCGVEDDRDCSPYNDAIKAIRKAKGDL